DPRSAERQWSGDPSPNGTPIGGLANRRPLRLLLPVRLPVLQPSGGHYPLAAGTQNGCEPVGSARVYRMNPQLPE
ncbi:MAG: hypothetical protein ACXVBY_18510, partial [Isosphaeraceae bacterium]